MAGAFSAIDSAALHRLTVDAAKSRGRPSKANQMMPRFFCLRLILLVLAASSAHADVLNLEQYRGKVVVVDFWASWCQPCRRSFPWLGAMQEKYRDRGLVVVGVNVDHERADADRFLKQVPARFDIVFDPDGELASRFEVPGMPSTYVFGPDGALITKHIGFKESAAEERETELSKLLTTAKP
jgi:cytochrome c biogenesis protein CcmG, thiol:disulfide interchange protein DsbE